MCQVSKPPTGRATKEPEGEGAGGEADGGGDGGVGGSRGASTKGKTHSAGRQERGAIPEPDNPQSGRISDKG